MDSSKKVNGVMCDVNTCGYNKDGNKCDAPSIHVGGRNAHQCNDTECDTFREK